MAFSVSVYVIAAESQRWLDIVVILARDQLLTPNELQRQPNNFKDTHLRAHARGEFNLNGRKSRL